MCQLRHGASLTLSIFDSILYLQQFGCIFLFVFPYFIYFYVFERMKFGITKINVVCLLVQEFELFSNWGRIIKNTQLIRNCVLVLFFQFCNDDKYTFFLVRRKYTCKVNSTFYLFFFFQKFINHDIQLNVFFDSEIDVFFSLASNKWERKR